MYKRCIICESGFKSLVLNGLKVRQCKRCGLIWRKDFNIPINYYGKKKVDLGQEKIMTRLSNSEDRLNKFKKYANLNNLCCIGCGDGNFLEVLRQKGYKNIIGIEPNIYFFNFARKRKLRVFKGIIEDFPKIIGDKNIHTVTMFHLIEHLKDPKKCLKLICNNLEKGDKLIIETPNIDAYLFKKSNCKNKLVYPEHLFYFNAENLSRLLRNTGFIILARGKRDFDQKNLSIKELLSRLGLSLVFKKNFNDDKNTKKAEILKTKRRNRVKNNKVKLLTKFVRKALSNIVISMGRLNYIWIVAEKK